jgi:hypothetical protein
MLDAGASSLVGSRPDGDPEAMRLYATSLSSSAALIAAAGRGGVAAVDAATFAGPAGDATRFRAARLRTRTARRAGELRTLADAIATRASAIEREQDAWDRIEQRNRRPGN